MKAFFASSNANLKAFLFDSNVLCSIGYKYVGRDMELSKLPPLNPSLEPYMRTITLFTLTLLFTFACGTSTATPVVGSFGPTGPTGSQGEIGPRGYTGPAGATGPQGPLGIQGGQGFIGPVGATGAQGVPGILVGGYHTLVDGNNNVIGSMDNTGAVYVPSIGCSLGLGLIRGWYQLYLADDPNVYYMNDQCTGPIYVSQDTLTPACVYLLAKGTFTYYRIVQPLQTVYGTGYYKGTNVCISGSLAYMTPIVAVQLPPKPVYPITLQ